MAYTGTCADGSRGTIISDIKSLCGINVTQEQWDATFGKHDVSRQRGYRARHRVAPGRVSVEETWYIDVDGVMTQCRRVTVNGEVVSYYEGSVRKI